MVVAGTRRSWSGLGMDYSGPNDLLRFGPHLAESRVDCPGTTAGNGNRTRMASLEGWNFTIKLCPRVGCRSGSDCQSGSDQSAATGRPCQEIFASARPGLLFSGAGLATPMRNFAAFYSVIALVPL